MTWTALIITIGGHIVGALPYPDAMSCGNALPAIHKALSVTHNDVMVQCKDSSVPKVRPKSRPTN